MIWFIKNGYVQAFLGGNAVAVHDLEAAIFGTTLGMTSSGQGVEGGHALHMRAINQVCRVGGIAAAVRQGLVTTGIMHALVTHQVPFVLAGSIRDDGPLPEVLSDTLAAQDAMRERTAQATFAVFVATAHDDLRRPDGVRGQQAAGPGHAPGLWRRHERPGLHARAAVLRGAMGAG